MIKSALIYAFSAVSQRSKIRFEYQRYIYSKRENWQSILLDNNKISTVSTFKINRQCWQVKPNFFLTLISINYVHVVLFLLYNLSLLIFWKYNFRYLILLQNYWGGQCALPQAPNAFNWRIASFIYLF